MDLTAQRKLLTETLEREQKRLTRIAEVYLSQAISGKVSAEDIVQEAYLIALKNCHRLDELTVSPFVWLRSLVQQCLIQQQRRYQSADKRDVNREVSLSRTSPDHASSCRLLEMLSLSQSTPSETVRKREAADMVGAALQSLSDADQEILRLRFFEDLRTSEIAEILGIQAGSVSARIGRALEHCESAILGLMPDVAQGNSGLS